MDEIDRRAIDQLPLRPHVTRTRLSHGGPDVDRSIVVQNSALNVRRDVPHSRDGRVVERVDGALAGGGRYHTRDSIADVCTLELDIRAPAGRDQSENLGQRRNPDLMVQLDGPDLIEAEVDNRFAAEALRQGGVVVNNDRSVSGLVDVELDSVRPALEGAAKSREGVFREFPRRAAMADLLHRAFSGGIRPRLWLALGSHAGRPLSCIFARADAVERRPNRNRSLRRV